MWTLINYLTGYVILQDTLINSPPIMWWKLIVLVLSIVVVVIIIIIIIQQFDDVNALQSLIFIRSSRFFLNTHLWIILLKF